MLRVKVTEFCADADRLAQQKRTTNDATNRERISLFSIREAGDRQSTFSGSLNPLTTTAVARFAGLAGLHPLTPGSALARSTLGFMLPPAPQVAASLLNCDLRIGCFSADGFGYGDAPRPRRIVARGLETDTACSLRNFLIATVIP